MEANTPKVIAIVFFLPLSPKNQATPINTENQVPNWPDDMLFIKGKQKNNEESNTGNQKPYML